MPRPQHDPHAISSTASETLANFHKQIVSEVATAVASEPVVIVGMAWNPFVRKARKMLGKENISFKYLEYGNYLMGWKPRLAIKLWSGWPTFPQVFVKGKLIGGSNDLAKALEDGSLKNMLNS